MSKVLAFLRDLLEKELMNTCSDEEKKLCGFMNPWKSYLPLDSDALIFLSEIV